MKLMNIIFKKCLGCVVRDSDGVLVEVWRGRGSRSRSRSRRRGGGVEGRRGGGVEEPARVRRRSSNSRCVSPLFFSSHGLEQTWDMNVGIVYTKETYVA